VSQTPATTAQLDTAAVHIPAHHGSRALKKVEEHFEKTWLPMPRLGTITLEAWHAEPSQARIHAGMMAPVALHDSFNHMTRHTL
jgi:hypothetical protein